MPFEDLQGAPLGSLVQGLMTAKFEGIEDRTMNFKKNFASALALGLILVGSTGLLSGCDSGGDQSGTGQAQISAERKSEIEKANAASGAAPKDAAAPK